MEENFSIYTVATFKHFNKTFLPSGMRVVGFYRDKERAIAAVEKNTLDIFEYYYEYALVERVDEGLYNVTEERQFFKWDHKLGSYQAIDEPKELAHIAGFTMS